MDGSPPGGGDASTRAPDPSQRPEEPERVFTRRIPRPGPWFAQYEARVSPMHASDPWRTEVVGAFAERTFRESLEAAIAGDDEALAPHLANRFAGSTELRPEELETTLDDGSTRVRRGTPKARRIEASGMAEVVGELVAPFRGAYATSVVAHATLVSVLPENQFEALVHVRLAGRRGEGALQANVAFRTTWRVAKKVMLLGLAVESFEEVELLTRPFAELTEHVLRRESFFAEGIGIGALERTRRHDRLTPFNNTYLGMNGMGVGDLDGDGREDLYVGRAGGLPNLLFSCTPDGTAHDIAGEAGVDFLDDTCGVLVADLDGDGHRDIAFGRAADIVIAWNSGGARFEATSVLAHADSEQVYSISAADADGDGDLDLYDTRYFRGGYGGGVPVPYHDAQNGAENLFWRNGGERAFTEDTKAVGLDHNNDRFSLASIWEDLDADGDLDLYVTNDFGRNNLYRNDGGTFVDVADDVGAVDMAAGMGVSCADVDLDGDVDLFVSNMYSPAGSRVTAQPQFLRGQPIAVRTSYPDHVRGNSLLLNRGDGTFEDGTDRGRAAPGGWTWGAVFTDIDNDGLADVVVPNGFLTGRIEHDLASFFWRVVVNASPVKPPADRGYTDAWRAITRLSQNEGLSWNGRERNYAYWNVGGSTFADASAACGLDVADDGRVACVVDWDGDGRLDLWTRNRTAPVLRFFHNRYPGDAEWIAFELAGPAPNTEAIGARVVVTAGELSNAKRVYAGEGYLASGSKRLHFGLGEHEGPVSISVEWPDGSVAEHEALEPGRSYRVAQGSDPVAVDSRPSALARAPGNDLPAAIGDPVGRMPLYDTLPWSRMALPSFDGEPREVADSSGRSLLVYLWASWDDRSVAGLAGMLELHRRRSDLDVWPLSMDGVRYSDYARSVAVFHGWKTGGRVDRRTKTVIETAIHEAVGAIDDWDLPVGMLFDEDGALCVFYAGGVDPAVVERDVASARERDGRWPVGLLGGRWVGKPPSRPLSELLIEHLGKTLGEVGLAAELEAAKGEREIEDRER